jgi:hypothetical protein
METEEYIDSEGRKWISPGKVADIWNERAKAEGHDSHYTRWSVRQRRKAMSYIQTPLGYLYLESDAYTVKLRARSTRRPDVAKSNRERAKPEDGKAA